MDVTQPVPDVVPAASAGMAVRLAVPARVTSPPVASAAACRIVARAEAMGIVEPASDGHFSVASLDDAVRGFAARGIGRAAASLRSAAADHPDVLAAINDDITASPVPETEWGSVAGILGLEAVAALVGISLSSARRYLDGARPTPDAVAVRLHHLALVVADLLSAYNEFGVRRWFQRVRRALDGRAPADLLSGDWSPDDAGPRAVSELAESALVMGAT